MGSTELNYIWRPFQLSNSSLFKVCTDFNERKTVSEHNSPVTGKAVWDFFHSDLWLLCHFRLSHIVLNLPEWVSEGQHSWLGSPLVGQPPSWVRVLPDCNFVKTRSYLHGKSASVTWFCNGGNPVKQQEEYYQHRVNGTRQKDFHSTRGRGFPLEGGEECGLWPGAASWSWRPLLRSLSCEIWNTEELGVIIWVPSALHF